VAEPQPPAPLPPPPRIFGPSSGPRGNLEVRNARRVGLSDLYHGLLRTSWTRLLLVVASGYVLINAGFGLVYLLLGGVANARTGSFADHFFFSVHTFGTIGYGSMYPQTNAAETVVSVEALVSVILNAVITGLAFAKFARPTSRVLWSKVAVVSDRDGVPTLMFRVANERMNHVVEATIRAAVLRAEVTVEGERIRRIVDLPLVRANSPSFILTWTVMHQVTRDSPLYGKTPEELAKQETELVLTLTGLDENLAQTIHSRQSYLASELVYGARFEDVIGGAAGRRVLDYARFHDTRPAPLSGPKMGLEGPVEVRPAG